MIQLRSFMPGDAAALRVMRYPGMDLQDVEKMIAAWNQKEFQGKYFEMFAVVQDALLVGSVSLYALMPGCAAIGPDIFPAERQKGYATAAMQLVLQLADEKGFRIIQQQIRADNTASLRLHERLGFETDGYVYQNQRGHEVLIWLKAL